MNPLNLLIPPPVTDKVNARREHESFLTYPNLVTVIRTVASVVLAITAIFHDSLTLLVIGVVTYWIGDSADGALARLTGRETRIGAVFDILCDRFCAAAFYVGLAWMHHDLAVPVFIYLTQFMVIDAFLSLSFLAWPLRSPNYFYAIDRRIWQWNWSHPGKATNSGLFAIILLVFRDQPFITGLGIAMALALVALKTWSVIRLARIGLPIPQVADDVAAA